MMVHPAERACRLAFVLVFLAASAAAAAPAPYVEFPPVTGQERAITSVPGYPNAPAVVLFKTARFSTSEPNDVTYQAVLRVSVRRKILTDEGSQRYGEVVVHHSRRLRLRNLEARTVLPDGRVIRLPKDAIFERRTSQNEKTFVTSIAFPSVVVGAILDYRYELDLGLGFFMEPWYFQEDVPTIHSEIAYYISSKMGARSWLEDPLHTGIQQGPAPGNHYGSIMAWGDNLPPLLEEPSSGPSADLASHFMLLPVSMETAYGRKDLFNSWPSTCEIYSKDYEKARRKTRDAERKGREIAQTVPGGGPRDKARALYRFVRDEITTDDVWGITLPADSTGDAVLAARQGSSAEKALLLQSLLAAAGIESRAVWAANRKDGLINLQFATPRQKET